MTQQNPQSSDVQPTNRRAFLKTTATAAAVATVGPIILGAEDKSGSKKAVTGTGEFTYECDHHWGQLPDNLEWRVTHGVCVDEAGLVYIKMQGKADQPMDTIVIFDADGKYVRSFGKEYSGGGHGIDIRKEDGQEFLYLSDTFHRLVAKTDLNGELVWALGYPRQPGVYEKAAQFSPTNLCFAPDGGFYIGDGYGSSYIHQYDKNAQWVRTWGGKGTEKGKLDTPHGLWLDDRPGREPSVAIADRANARLQNFTLDGEHISFVEGVSFPADVDIRGEVLLCPDLFARLALYDIDNNLITYLGYEKQWYDHVVEDVDRGMAEIRKGIFFKDGFKIRREPKDWPDGLFIHPHDACFDHQGNIFVTEWVDTGRVSFLKKVG